MVQTACGLLSFVGRLPKSKRPYITQDLEHFKWDVIGGGKKALKFGYLLRAHITHRNKGYTMIRKYTITPR